MLRAGRIPKIGIIALVISFFLLCGQAAWAESHNPPMASAQAAPAPNLNAPVDVSDAHPPSAEELANGWRLSCQCSLIDDLVIELRQWDAAILADDTAFSFAPRAGLGVAVGVGLRLGLAPGPGAGRARGPGGARRPSSRPW